MHIDEGARKFCDIFVPGLIEETLKVYSENRRFAYYTSADTAMKVIQNCELWLRNVTVMNDFKEITYGLELIQQTFSGKAGERFREAVDSIFPETVQQAEMLLGQWVSDWKYETYIACISKHDDSEDEGGRLSMWRAYGNTALVIRNTPMMATTDELGVYSIPVMYESQGDHEARLGIVTDNILANADYLRKLGQLTLVAYIQRMLFQTAIGSKHPGFAEEKEWRIYYRPSERKSAIVKEKAVVLSGVPQIVYAIPLKHDPENGLHHADIPSLLERIIIGPTNYPYVSYRAFSKALADEGVAENEVKIVMSDIPLRSE